MPQKTYEDFPPGAEFALGPWRVERDEMVEFAREFDPQPFHVDEEAGRRSILGGLAASGWYTLAALMRMTYDAFLCDTASMGSPGIEAVKWARPVLAGDTLTGTATVLGARILKSRPTAGLVHFRFELRNQRDELVLTETTNLMIERREA